MQEVNQIDVIKKTSLSSRGYGLPISRFSQDEIKKIKKELTVSPENFGYIKIPGLQQPTFEMFQESVSKLYVPKFYGLNKFGLPEEVKWREGDEIDISFSGQLRKEQEGPVSSFLKSAYDENKRGGIINLSCAGGKTVIALNIISQLKRKTLIIVHKNFLLEQWNERISQFLPEARVGYIRGKILDIENKDIVIASLQSLSMKDYDPIVFKSFGFLIVDEIHRTGTEVFSKALLKTCFKYSLGLTATLERNDGLTKVFIWSIGDVVYKDKSRVDRVFIKYIPFTLENIDDLKEETIFNGKPNMSKMITDLSEYMPRNTSIIQKIREEIEEANTRRFLVLSDRKNQLYKLKQLLDEIQISTGLYIGGMKDHELKESEQKQIILATYSFASEGFDVPGLDTLILATPKTNMEQIIGRILREKPELRRNVPLLIDFCDVCFTCFVNQYNKRKRYYKKMKYEFI